MTYVCTVYVCVYLDGIVPRLRVCLYVVHEVLGPLGETGRRARLNQRRDHVRRAGVDRRLTNIYRSFVTHTETTSNMYIINSGISQGSVRGPVLYLCDLYSTADFIQGSQHAACQISRILRSYCRQSVWVLLR